VACGKMGLCTSDRVFPPFRLPFPEIVHLSVYQWKRDLGIEGARLPFLRGYAGVPLTPGQTVDQEENS
jgi:hypothetical protein